MRLTLALWRQHTGRMIQRHWRVQGERKMEEIPISPLLIQKGVTIHDPVAEKKKALEPEEEEDRLKIHWVKPLPTPLHRKFDLPEPYAGDMTLHNDEKHPLWKEKTVYHVTKKTRMICGIEQALAMTKSVKYDGLPSRVLSLIGKCNIPNQEEIVSQHLKFALLWDSFQRKLPKQREFPEMHRWVKRKYGVHQARKVANIIDQMTTACEKITAGMKGSLDRMRLENASCRTMLTRDDKTLLFDLETELLLTSKDPIAPFATVQETNETIDQKIPDIYPVTYTLHVKQSNIYKSEEKPAILPEAVNSHLHTIALGHSYKSFWNPNNKSARGILACFGFAAAQARQKYGLDVKDLPEPMCVQCMFTDVQNSGFVAFQLNTLDIESTGGKKNQVWFDGPHQLYEECDQTVGLRGYNPQIFDKFLAFYMNGLEV